VTFNNEDEEGAQQLVQEALQRCPNFRDLSEDQ